MLDGDLGGWPLWVEEREDLDDLIGSSRPSDWPMLSDSLKRDLVSWNDDFLAHWPVLSRRRRAREFASTACVLVSRVQAELGDGYIVCSSVNSCAAPSGLLGVSRPVLSDREDAERRVGDCNSPRRRCRMRDR